jgi:hypothetical protein
MAWHVTSDIDEFENAAGDFLLADPVRNTVLLTVTASLKSSGADAYGDAPPYFGWYDDDSGIQGAFLRTPPRPALVSDAPEHAVESLVEVLEGVRGLSGPDGSVRAFAHAWHVATGRHAKVASNRHLYRLTELTPPREWPPGGPRAAAEADRDVLAQWFTVFGTDVGAPIRDPMRAVDRCLANGELLLWEVGAVPVAMAGATRPIAGVTRVAPVYTPATLRGRGYAAAVTADISWRGMEAGHQVILFADMANATSNALYQRLGYRAIGRWSELDLA